MNNVDPRTPVLVGVGQFITPPGQQPGPEPLDAWIEATQQALQDAGLGGAVLAEVDAVALADCMSWRYDDPVARFSERLGATPHFQTVGAPSGTSGQTLLNQVADEIRAGRADLGLVCGGEMLATLRRHRLQGETPLWSHPHPDGPQFAFDLDARQHPGEVAIGLTEGIGAVYGFAMREVARRAHLGRSPEAYRADMGEMLAGMTEVAETNPYAWFPKARAAGFLTEPRADNRYVAYPYTKHMVAIIEVDISATLIVASEAWADAHDVPSERRVYPWTSCYAEDPVYIAVRDELWRSPAMAEAGQAVLEAAGVSIDRVAHLDLYSCFSSAVNFAGDALGVRDRGNGRMTVTGGLPYAGGPASSYVLTSIARMTQALRADPGAFGLVSGVGMMMSNHVFALYSTTPPPTDLRHPDASAIQERLDAIPQRRIDDAYVGPAKIATYTVMHGRDGAPSHGAAICDLPDGARSYVTIRNPELLAQAEQRELVGRQVLLAPGQAVSEVVRLLD